MSKYESLELGRQLYCFSLRLCLGCGVVSLTDQILMEQIQWDWMGRTNRKIHTQKPLKILLWKKTLDCCQQSQCRWSSCQGCVVPLVGWESIVGCEDDRYVMIGLPWSSLSTILMQMMQLSGCWVGKYSWLRRPSLCRSDDLECGKGGNNANISLKFLAFHHNVCMSCDDLNWTDLLAMTG